MSKQKGKLWLLVLLAAAVIGAAALVGFLLAGRAPASPAADASDGSDASAGTVSDDLAVDDDDSFGRTVTVDGQRYQLRQGLNTILFLGIDEEGTAESGNTIGTGGRSDTITLFILDESTQTTQMLQISRDSMTDVEVYDAEGNYLYTGEMQLTMQYAFGKTPRISCRLTSEAVSQLLFGVKIDACVSLTMDGIDEVVDALGGVDVTMTQDHTDINEAFVDGETVHLDGTMAFDFVHYRDISTSGSNDTRMERQDQMLQAVFQKIHSGADSLSAINAMWSAAEPYLQSDLDATDIRDLAQYTLLDETLKVPGETVEGELHDEYRVDDEALQALILQLFYKTAEN